jgi:CHASE2 domain-containing sensor protein
MKSGFWERGLVSRGRRRASDLIPNLERNAYDLGVAATTRTPSDRIAVIAIDDTSLENIGRWPWSRYVIAVVIELLATSKAKVIGNAVCFSEPQIDPGYVYITKLLEPPADIKPSTQPFPTRALRAAVAVKAGGSVDIEL